MVPAYKDPAPQEEPGKMGEQQLATGILSCGSREVTPVDHCFSSHPLFWGAAGRFEASVIEERRKGAEDLLRFTVHIPALNNSPQLKEFFRVCVPACPSPAPGKPACPLGCTPRHPPPGPCLSLLQGGEVTRPSGISRDLHILPPPLIPTPPPEEPWLPQPLPAERRGLEELEVPGMLRLGREPGLAGLGVMEGMHLLLTELRKNSGLCPSSSTTKVLRSSSQATFLL